MIYADGSVHNGRPEGKIGAHCLGHNTSSIGIAYVGGLTPDGSTPADTRTEAQKSSLRALVEHLRAKYPGCTVHGHREFASKACPCFDVRKEL